MHFPPIINYSLIKGSISLVSSSLLGTRMSTISLEHISIISFLWIPPSLYCILSPTEYWSSYGVPPFQMGCLLLLWIFCLLLFYTLPLLSGPVVLYYISLLQMHPLIVVSRYVEHPSQSPLPQSLPINRSGRPGAVASALQVRMNKSRFQALLLQARTPNPQSQPL